MKRRVEKEEEEEEGARDETFAWNGSGRGVERRRRTARWRREASNSTSTGLTSFAMGRCLLSSASSGEGDSEEEEEEEDDVVVGMRADSSE